MKTQLIDFWNVSDEEKLKLFNKVKDKYRLSPKAVEKDWWVSHVIKSIFSLRCAPALTFKGGTSLSKAWGVTERFSEDVDISFDKSFFGLTGDTRSQRDRIRKLTRAYIHDEVLDELASTLFVYGAWQSEVKFKNRRDSDADPSVLLIPYRSLLPEDEYIKGYVKVEFSSRSPREPREFRSIQPIVAQLSPMIDFPVTVVPTVVPTRTFLEKVFLLHEEFQKNYPRYKRMSRHLYDLQKLDDAGYADKALADEELYRSLVEHRRVFSAMRGIDYSGHTPSNIRIIPPKELLPLWEEDYRMMSEQFIYGETLPFDKLIDRISSIQARINALPFSL